MKTYQKPIIIENDELHEGVYAVLSGDDTDYWVEVKWENHNSGSHSDIRVIVHTGSTAGTYINVTIKFIGDGGITDKGSFQGPYTQAPIFSSDNKSVTFIREGSFNANENFSYSWNNVVFSGNGDNHDTSEHCGSYYEGQGNGYLGDAISVGDFAVVSVSIY